MFLSVITGDSLPIRLSLLGLVDMLTLVWLGSPATHPYEAAIAVEDKDPAGSPDQLGCSAMCDMDGARARVP